MKRISQAQADRDKRHGADRIPQEQLAQVELLLREGNKQLSSELLESLALQYRLKSYEVFHIAQFILNKVTSPERQAAR